jgi:hypothetical protein
VAKREKVAREGSSLHVAIHQRLDAYEREVFGKAGGVTAMSGAGVKRALGAMLKAGHEANEAALRELIRQTQDGEPTELAKAASMILVLLESVNAKLEHPGAQ